MTRPTTDGDTKRCDAVEPRWPDERCGALAGHEGQHSYHEHVEALWAHISEQEVELERLRLLEREARALVADPPSPPAWYEEAPSFKGYTFAHVYVAGYDVARFYLRRALTPTTQDREG